MVLEIKFNPFGDEFEALVFKGSLDSGLFHPFWFSAGKEINKEEDFIYKDRKIPIILLGLERKRDNFVSNTYAWMREVID